MPTTTFEVLQLRKTNGEKIIVGDDILTDELLSTLVDLAQGTGGSVQWYTAIQTNQASNYVYLVRILSDLRRMTEAGTLVLAVFRTPVVCSSVFGYVVS